MKCRKFRHVALFLMIVLLIAFLTAGCGGTPATETNPSGTVFAGTEGGGIYKSTDGGASWTSSNSGLTNINISSLAVSPDFSHDKTVFTSSSDGVFKSTDGGNSWFAVNSGFSDIGVSNMKSVGMVAVSPDFVNDQAVFAGGPGLNALKQIEERANTGDHPLASILVQGYVYRSTDGGNSWSKSDNSENGFLGLIPVFWMSISPAVASDQTVFTGTNQGVFRSTDGGQNWVYTMPANHCVPPSIYSMAVSPNFDSDKTVFAANTVMGSCQPITSEFAGSELYKSTDGGSTWSQPIKISPQYTFINWLAISPEFGTDKTLFAGGVGSEPGRSGAIYKSADGGNSWLESDDGVAPNSNVSTTVVSRRFGSNQTVYAGTSNGIFKSTDAGTKWTAANSGIPPNTNVICMAVAD